MFLDRTADVLHLWEIHARLPLQTGERQAKRALTALRDRRQFVSTGSGLVARWKSVRSR